MYHCTHYANTLFYDLHVKFTKVVVTECMILKHEIKETVTYVPSQPNI